MFSREGNKFTKFDKYDDRVSNKTVKLVDCQYSFKKANVQDSHY